MSLIHHISIFLSRLCQKIWWKADTKYFMIIYYKFMIHIFRILLILDFIFGTLFGELICGLLTIFANSFLVDCLKSWLWPPANICAILNFIFGTLLKSWLWSTYYSYYLCYFEFHFWYIVWRVDCGLLTLRCWLRAQSSLSNKYLRYKMRR